MTDFVTFARSHGLLIEYAPADDRIHRCRTETKPRKRNGAFRFDGSRGWVMDWTVHHAPIVFRSGAPVSRCIQALRDERIAEEARARKGAAERAEAMLRGAEYGVHPYLAAKGFPAQKGPVFDGALLVPMRSAKNYSRLLSVQMIQSDGTKKFLPGGQAGGACFRLGSGSERWYVEGYATGLSVLSALKAIYRSAEVVVCFNAGNLVKVSEALGPGYVFADHDRVKAGVRAGESAARATGLPWTQSPVEGEDANDLHLRQGLRAVSNLMQHLLREVRMVV